MTKYGFPVLKANVVQGDDIVVIQRPGEPCFAFETLQQRAVNTQRLGHHLEGDVSAQPRVPRPVDFGHAAGVDQGNDLVPAHPCAWLQTPVSYTHLTLPTN